MHTLSRETLLLVIIRSPLTRSRSIDGQNRAFEIVKGNKLQTFWMYRTPIPIPPLSTEVFQLPRLLPLSKQVRHETTTSLYLSPMRLGRLCVARSVNIFLVSNAHFLSSCIWGIAVISAIPGTAMSALYFTNEVHSPISSRQTPRLYTSCCIVYASSGASPCRIGCR